MLIQNFPIGDIKPYDRNPRNNDSAVAAVSQSIKEFGFLNPIIVDAEKVIICGHTRYRAAQLLGMKEVPCVVANDLTPDQVKAFRIADNKTGETSTWDYDALIREINALKESNYDVSMLGFANEALAELLYHDEEDGIAGGETDPDEVPELSGETRSRNGATYVLGRHILCVGTANYPSSEKAALYIAVTHDFVDSLSDRFMEAGKVLKPGAAIYCFLPDSIDELWYKYLYRSSGFVLLEKLLWLHEDIVQQGNYAPADEVIHYCKNGSEPVVWYGDMKQSNVRIFKKTASGGCPVELLVQLIRNSTAREDVIYCNLTDTGTEVIAAEQTGRRCVVIADTPEKADVIRKRWAEFTEGRGCNWEQLTPEAKR